LRAKALEARCSRLSPDLRRLGGPATRGPHEAVMEALVRLLERTCPPSANRTMPDTIHEVLTRLRSHGKPTPEVTRPGRKG
jgi:hypothetical protein